MFNLLPQTEKQIITREYRLRFVATCLFFFSIICGVAIISLIPSLFSSGQIENDIQKKYDLLNNEVANISRDNPSDVLTAATKKSEALSLFSDHKTAYELIDRVVKSRTAGIKLVGVNIRAGNTGVRDVSILGQAVDRESLLSYAKVLRESKLFSEVTVPVSNFAPAVDIKFSIQAKVDEKGITIEKPKKTTSVKEEE